MTFDSMIGTFDHQIIIAYAKVILEAPFEGLNGECVSPCHLVFETFYESPTFFSVFVQSFHTFFVRKPVKGNKAADCVSKCQKVSGFNPGAGLFLHANIHTCFYIKLMCYI